MGKFVTVIAVPHQLQGAGFDGFVRDPSYRALLEDHLQEVDFVFEEATGHAPSIARELADRKLGIGHYLDIDPTPSERVALGIAAHTSSGGLLNPMRAMSGDPADAYGICLVDEQPKREKVWVDKMKAQSFEKAIVICGLAHTLSLAVTLRNEGIGNAEAYTYDPPHRLCTRPHA